jgi:2-keto-4-pentenoate hydratase/2-oxohepta-3-ene-1,7-dioic acid hydratase in catechol pathway
MRLANLDGRLAIANGDGFVDAEAASDGRFGPDPQSVYERWTEFREWASPAPLAGGAELDIARLGPPVPRPRQVFAVALNYPEHAAEGGFTKPDAPLIFTKFPTCLAGPVTDVALATAFVDWEVELVVVIGDLADHVKEADAWDHVAGLTVGQDLSARDVQRAGPAPQFSLGKSFRNFGPTGPWVVSTDEPGMTGELELECLLGGERVQHETTSAMIFSVAELIAFVSAICAMLPGDLLFTGTPSGVGSRRDPPVYLRAGDQLTSKIAGIGEIHQTFHDK